ncbi:PLP-dependent decarboxylase, partial [Candidatus Peregrinibacteria bacterium]|nr:PLP-dependent decarboxylase [Candidatus Peregrinibacteria bacterium]
LNKKSSASLKFKVHGPLCTSLDDLGEYDLPVELNVNDWLIFHKTGAYSLTESMPYFLCHDFSSLFILNDGEINQVDEKSAGFCWK